MKQHSDRDLSFPAWLIGILILTAGAAQASRILSVRSITGETPFLSANDRSRWCTVASLVERRTYEIDAWLTLRDPKTKRLTWSTIDLVRHRGSDGKQHYYSSKPPLLATLYAGVYWLLRAMTGTSLTNSPFYAARAILLLVNFLPLVGYWYLWSRWLRRENLDGWSHYVLMCFIVWGTFISTFAATLNNHLPAAVSALLSLWAVDRILMRDDERWRWYMVAGVATSFTAANELPALSWVAAVGCLLWLHDWRRAVLGYALATLPVAIAFSATTYLAHGDLLPPYLHRDLGELIASLPLDESGSSGKYETKKIIEKVRQASLAVSDSATIRPSRETSIFELWDPVEEVRFALTEQGNRLNIHHWDDWYDYPNSYWYAERKQGVDKGEESRATYALHTLIGHHGIFSLTPFWFMAVIGCFQLARRGKSVGYNDKLLQIMVAIAGTTIVCLAFYWLRPLQDRNYGGVTSGFRWMFWFSPLWCWLCMFGLQAIKQNWQRVCVEVILAISVFSACYAWSNPWTSPWIMQYFEYVGWLKQ